MKILLVKLKNFFLQVFLYLILNKKTKKLNFKNISFLWDNKLILKNYKSNSDNLRILYNIQQKKYEKNLINFLYKHTKKNSVFFDIGGGFGYLAIFMSIIVGNNGKVIVFEANKKNFFIIENLFKINKCNNTITVNKFVSSSSKIINFLTFQNPFISQNSDTGNILIEIKRYLEEFHKYISIQNYEELLSCALEGEIKRVYFELKLLVQKNRNLYLKNKKRIDYIISVFFNFNRYQFKKNQTQAISLDSYINKNKIYPDIIKIDVEGEEMEVIRGLFETIKYKPPYLIIIEIHFEDLIFKSFLKDKRFANFSINQFEKFFVLKRKG
jgi:FkbM family methyltransferase